MAAGYGLAGHPWAVSQEPTSVSVPTPGYKPCLEAAFGRDANAAPSYSDIPPPDNESNKTLTGSCIGGMVFCGY